MKILKYKQLNESKSNLSVKKKAKEELEDFLIDLIDSKILSDGNISFNCWGTPVDDIFIFDNNLKDKGCYPVYLYENKKSGNYILDAIEFENIIQKIKRISKNIKIVTYRSDSTSKNDLGKIEIKNKISIVFVYMYKEFGFSEEQIKIISILDSIGYNGIAKKEGIILLSKKYFYTVKSLNRMKKYMHSRVIDAIFRNEKAIKEVSEELIKTYTEIYKKYNKIPNKAEPIVDNKNRIIYIDYVNKDLKLYINIKGSISFNGVATIESKIILDSVSYGYD